MLYPSLKIVLIITTLVLIFMKFNSTDYFYITATLPEIVEGEVSSKDYYGKGGVYLTEIEQGTIKNEEFLGCNGVMTDGVMTEMANGVIESNTIDQCRMLSVIKLFDITAVTLLLLSFVPKYGESSGAIAAIVVFLSCILTFIFANDVKDEVVNKTTPEGSVVTDEQYGIGLAVVVSLFVLSMFMFAQSVFGIYLNFMC